MAKQTQCGSKEPHQAAFDTLSVFVARTWPRFTDGLRPCFRVLGFCIADHLCKLAGDETLRFWNLFPGPRTTTASQETTVGSMMRTHIR